MSIQFGSIALWRSDYVVVIVSVFSLNLIPQIRPDDDDDRQAIDL